MDEKKISFLLIPLLLSYQTSFGLSTDDSILLNQETKIQELHTDATFEDNTLIIPNQSVDQYQKKKIVAQRMSMIEKHLKLLNDDHEKVNLGYVLSSMSGTILFGMKE